MFSYMIITHTRRYTAVIMNKLQVRDILYRYEIFSLFLVIPAYTRCGPMITVLAVTTES
jgi:hypothetical protein